MTVAKTINQYARPYSPYASGLVNHLPMGQLALYMMGKDLIEIKSYSDNYVKDGKIDPVKSDYNKVTSIKECLAKRELYEGCLELITEEITTKGPDVLIKEVLNDYPLGMSSGLFHTTIRLAYSVEGMKQDKGLIEEVARALAYYITAYRPGEQFHHQVPGPKFAQAVKALLEDSHIIELLSAQPTRGQQIKALYQDESYLKKAPIIEGEVKEKVAGLLELLLPQLDATNNIVILHCVTGLHALLVLEEYFHDFSHAVDIMTACIITHLLTVEGVHIKETDQSFTNQSWDTIIAKVTATSSVHTIKFIYSAYQLHQKYKLPSLRRSAATRVGTSMS